MGQSGLGLMYFYGKGVDQVQNLLLTLTHFEVCSEEKF